MEYFLLQLQMVFFSISSYLFIGATSLGMEPHRTGAGSLIWTISAFAAFGGIIWGFMNLAWFFVITAIFVARWLGAYVMKKTVNNSLAPMKSYFDLGVIILTIYFWVFSK